MVALDETIFTATGTAFASDMQMAKPGNIILKRVQDTQSKKKKLVLLQEISSQLAITGVETAVDNQLATNGLTDERSRQELLEIIFALDSFIKQQHAERNLMNKVAQVFIQLIEHPVSSNTACAAAAKIICREGKSFRGIHSHRSHFATCEALLRITLALLRKTGGKTGVSLEQLVDAFASIFHVGMISAENARGMQVVSTLVHNDFPASLRGDFATIALAKADAADGGVVTLPILHVLTLLSATATNGAGDVVKQDATSSLNTFCKVAFQQKLPPNIRFVRAHAGAILSSTTAADISGVILPAIQKAMLRSPESFVFAVAMVIQRGLSTATLSKQSSLLAECSENLLPYLFSTKDEKATRAVGDAFDRLAENVQDSDALGKLVEQCFALLQGKLKGAPKLATANEKVIVLSLVDKLARLAKVRTIQGEETGTNVMALFLKASQAESHEQVLEALYRSCDQWLRKIHYTSITAISKAAEFLRIGLQSGKPIKIRIATLLTLVDAVGMLRRDGDVEEEKQKLTALLADKPIFDSLSSMIKTLSGGPTPAAQVQEALGAATLLLQHARCRTSVDVDLKAVGLQFIIDPKRDTFCSPTLINSLCSASGSADANENPKLLFIHFIQTVASYLTARVPPQLMQSYADAFFAVLLSPTTRFDTVREGGKAVEFIVQYEPTPSMCCLLFAAVQRSISNKIAQLDQQQQQQQTPAVSSAVDDSGVNVEAQDRSNVSRRAYYLLQKICSSVQTCETLLVHREAEKIVISSLLVLHHPALGKLGPTLWLNLFRQFSSAAAAASEAGRPSSADGSRVRSPSLASTFDLHRFAAQRAADILPALCSIDAARVTQLSLAALEEATKTLVIFSEDSFVGQILRYVEQQLPFSDVSNFSDEQVAVFRTAEGELHDTSVLEDGSGAKKPDLSTKGNIKRESKAYSYKDQMAEIELRKELEAKRKKAAEAEAKVAGGEFAASSAAKRLTPAQEKLKKQQLEVETKTRAEVRPTYVKVQRLLAMIRACAAGKPTCIGAKLAYIEQKIMMPLLRQPLTAELAVDFWVNIGVACVSDARFAEQCAYATLRTYEPPCTLPARFCQEKLSVTVERLVNVLYKTFWSAVEGTATDEADEDTGAMANGGGDGRFRPGGAATYKLTAKPEVSTATFCYAFRLVDLAILQRRAAYAPGNRSDSQQPPLEFSENLPMEALGLIEACLKGCLGRTRKAAADSSKAGAAAGSAAVVDDDLLFGDEQTFDAKALPTKKLITLLADIGKGRGVGGLDDRVQIAACNVLLLLAECIDGASGHAQADAEDIHLLLMSLESSKLTLRETAIRSLRIIIRCLHSFSKQSKQNDLYLQRRLFVAASDSEPSVCQPAQQLFHDLGLDMNLEVVDEIFQDLIHEDAFMRKSAAAALALLVKHEDTSDGKLLLTIVDRLCTLYAEKLKLPKPELDEYGVEIKVDPAELLPARLGVATALLALVDFLQPKLYEVFDFLLNTACALKDASQNVRIAMLQLGTSLVDVYGKAHASELMQRFETFMSRAPKTAEYDIARSSVIILMGNLARELPADDARRRPILDRLLQSVTTPSEQVQEAVAACLPSLISALDEADANRALQQQLNMLFDADKKYAVRRGAAYAIGGVSKGMGVVWMKKQRLYELVLEAVQDKKHNHKKEGGFMAFTMLSKFIGRAFEPYVVQFMPHLLSGLGDGNNHVRQAAEETNRVVMKQLSPPAVKLILPSLLKTLEDTSGNWRTKVGAAEVLGRLAHGAPKQLSSSLPQIVPHLLDVLRDSHHRVQEAGTQALKSIAAVITNPEISAVIKFVLLALQEPSTRTVSCLKKLIHTQFVHIIDAPSLALIMPVIERAIRERSTESRRMAALIMASLYALCRENDLMPYMQRALPALQSCLLDPAPDVRAAAAKAISSLLKATQHQEQKFAELYTWMNEKLVSPLNSVDRSGAAQGLAECLGVLRDVEKRNAMIEQFARTAEDEDEDPYVRDGNLLMFLYLPVVIEEEFIGFISRIIPPLLKGLADEKEFVRDTAMLCGQRIVNSYANSAIELLLPELERSIFDENWRIRLCTVRLLGELLYKISGASGKKSTEGATDEESFGTQQGLQSIFASLGRDRRDRVMSELYICRSDVAFQVRQAAVHVWKIIVTNTLSVVREMLPVLFSILLESLAAEDDERKLTAARCMGELVHKLGDRILPDVLDNLQRGLLSESRSMREGVCIGLMEVVRACPREQLVVYSDTLLPIVKRAIADRDEAVRRYAAEAFSVMDTALGQHKVLDAVLPELFERIDDPEVGEFVLQGLQEIMRTKSKALLPYLIPHLVAPPVNSKALSLLTCVATSEALNRYLPRILPALLDTMQRRITEGDAVREQEELGYLRQVVSAIDDDQGLHCIIDELLSGSQLQNARRAAALSTMAVFFGETKLDFSLYLLPLMRIVMRNMAVDDDPEIVRRAFSAMEALLKSLPAESSGGDRINALRQAIRFAINDARRQGQDLPGLCLPNAIAPFVPLIRDTLIHGRSEDKETAALVATDLVRASNVAALKTSVLTVAGPLIRVLGDRYGPQVRVALLDALAALVEKCSILLKPFVPQIKTTVIRALSDPTRQVRLRAVHNIALLVPIHGKPEALITEITELVRTQQDAGIQEAALIALRVVARATDVGKLSVAIVSPTIQLCLMSLVDHGDELNRKAAGGVVGAGIRTVPEAAEDEAGKQLYYAGVIKNNVVIPLTKVAPAADINWLHTHGLMLSLQAALSETCERVFTSIYGKQAYPSSAAATEQQQRDILFDAISVNAQHPHLPVATAAYRVLGLSLVYLLRQQQQVPKVWLQLLVKGFNSQANDVKQVCAQLCGIVGVCAADGVAADQQTLRTIVVQLVNGTKEKNLAVKAESEVSLILLLQLQKSALATSNADAESVLNKVYAKLESGARDALREVVEKQLPKIINQQQASLQKSVFAAQLDDTVVNLISVL